MSGAVKLNSSGGGSVTLTPPSTASNLTVTLPSASGTLATTSGTGSVFTNPTINGFTGDTSVINVGSGQFYKDTSGNVGIGTSSPGQKLVVSGSGAQRFDIIDTGGATGRISTASGTVYVGTTTNHPLALFTNDSVKATLDASGNLGIGVTPSAWATYKALQIGPNLAAGFIAGAGNDTYFGDSAYYNAGWKYAYTGISVSAYRQTAGQHIWYTAPSGTAGNAISFTQAMTLDASGNLLVGRTSQIASEQLGIGYDGSVKQGAYFTDSSAAATVTMIGFYKAGAQRGSITSTSTATAYNITSDQRLKTNIAPAGSAVQSILDFPVDQFDWISTGEHQDFGAVAQKAVNVIPEMVSIPADPNEMWGIDWSKAVPRLIRAYQELSAKNSELESRLAALEGK